jgi:hypothetical protein
MTTTNYRTKWFACLEFKLVADSAAKMFESDDREHYTVIGHDDTRCSAIAEKRKVEATSLDAYLVDHEFFDGELTFADPWPCSKCIPTTSLPAWAPMKDQVVGKVPTEPTAKSNLKPYRTTLPGNDGIKPAESATEAQVRKMMVLYRRDKPNATKEAKAAAEARAMSMTKKQASAVIDKMEKGELKITVAAETPAPTMTKGAKVAKNGHPGTIFWVGEDKRGGLRYGVEYIDQDGNKQREFTSTGWTVVT